MNLPSSSDTLWIVYDGQCPFCSAYVRLLRLRETVSDTRLVDARSNHPILEEVSHLDLNQGMVAKYGGQLYYGADCMHLLALLSTPTGAFNRIMRGVFRHHRLARLLYPPLRAGRNAALRLLGRKQL